MGSAKPTLSDYGLEASLRSFEIPQKKGRIASEVLETRSSETSVAHAEVDWRFAIPFTTKATCSTRSAKRAQYCLTQIR